jgi:hypothetical protein
MAKMRIGSAGSSSAVEATASEVTSVVETERVVTVEIPKPVTKEVIVEIPKPVYKIVEVEQVVQKPKIKVEEVAQTVIKPVFTIKQESIVLDQLQKKVEETVSVASSKLATLNAIVLEQALNNDEQKQELSQLKVEVKALRTLVVIAVVSSVIATLASVLG